MWRPPYPIPHTPHPSSRASRAGQSIAEVLIAVAIGVILVGSASSLILPALRSNTQVTKVQAGSVLAKGLQDNVRVFSEDNWDNLLALATGTGNPYHLMTASSPFVATTGVEMLTVGTATYARYFYLSDVYRTGAGMITSSGGGTYDPSTKLVTVVYSWSGVASQTLGTFLTRNRNFVFDQTDWSGGSGLNGPVTTTNSQFSTSSNIDYSTTTGSFYLAIPGY